MIPIASPEARIRAAGRYNAKTYDQLSVRLEKDLVQQFRAALQQTGDSAAGVFRQALIQYVTNTNNNNDKEIEK